MSAVSTPLRVGSIAAFAAAAGAIAAGVAGGVTESTGIAAGAAIVTAVLAYGVAPLVISVALRLSALASWWAVAAAAIAAVLWVTVVALATPATAFWIVVASLEVVRAGLQRWSLFVLAGFVSALMIGSLFIQQSGFNVAAVAVPLGWAAWMLELGRALRSHMNPLPAPVETREAEACANCGAPRRRDGLAFCAECGLPYSASRSDS